MSSTVLKSLSPLLIVVALALVPTRAGATPPVRRYASTPMLARAGNLFATAQRQHREAWASWRKSLPSWTWRRVRRLVVVSTASLLLLTAQPALAAPTTAPGLAPAPAAAELPGAPSVQESRLTQWSSPEELQRDVAIQSDWLAMAEPQLRVLERQLLDQTIAVQQDLLALRIRESDAAAQAAVDARAPAELDELRQHTVEESTRRLAMLRQVRSIQDEVALHTAQLKLDLYLLQRFYNSPLGRAYTQALTAVLTRL